MTLEELQTIVTDGESDRVEFKETTGQRVDACRTLCAFLNGDGGTVVFGVARNGKLIGQQVSDETRKNLAAEFVKFEPGVELSVEFVTVDDAHQAIVVSVQHGKARPYQYDGRAYRRMQSSTGAVVLFGRELADYPQCYLRMARFSGTDKTEFADSRNVQGNLFHLASEAIAFCFKHLNLSGKTRGRLKRTRSPCSKRWVWFSA